MEFAVTVRGRWKAVGSTAKLHDQWPWLLNNSTPDLIPYDGESWSDLQYLPFGYVTQALVTARIREPLLLHALHYSEEELLHDDMINVGMVTGTTAKWLLVFLVVVRMFYQHRGATKGLSTHAAVVSVTPGNMGM